jgi:hypothetical protein
LNVDEPPPLAERFEQAYAEFSEVYNRKAREARSGTRFYSEEEFLEDLYACAGNHGLFAEAL